jgi:hypothetical protein
MRELKVLNLRSTQIDGSGLVHLQALPKLEELVLVQTHCNDAGLLHLRTMTQLKTLYLSQTKITDAGLINLKPLKNLEILNFQETEVTDKGLVHLLPLVNLKRVYTCYGVTEKGEQELKMHLPHVEINPPPRIENQPAATAPTKRRWYEFSLQTFCVLVMLASAGFGYWKYWSKAWIRQRHEH